MQPTRALCVPVLRHRYRINAVHGLTRVVALLELYALTAAYIDRRNDVQGVLSSWFVVDRLDYILPTTDYKLPRKLAYIFSPISPDFSG